MTRQPKQICPPTAYGQIRVQFPGGVARPRDRPNERTIERTNERTNRTFPPRARATDRVRNSDSARLLCVAFVGARRLVLTHARAETIQTLKERASLGGLLVFVVVVVLVVVVVVVVCCCCCCVLTVKSPLPQSAVSSHHTGAIGFCSCCCSCCCWTLRGWRHYLAGALLVVVLVVLVVVGPFVDGDTTLRGLCLLSLLLVLSRSIVSFKSPGELLCVFCVVAHR